MNKTIFIKAFIFICSIFLFKENLKGQDTPEKLFYQYRAEDPCKSPLDYMPSYKSKVEQQLKNHTIRSNPKQFAFSNLLLGIIYYNEFDPAKAQPYLIFADSFFSRTEGEYSDISCEAKAYLSWNYGIQNLHQEELDMNLKLLNYYKQNSKKNILKIADTYKTIGMNYERQSNPYEEQINFNIALNLLKTAYFENDSMQNVRNRLLADVYASIAISNRTTGNLILAKDNATAALKLYEKVCKILPAEVVGCLSTL
jgi:hypothetical protein